MEKAKLFWKRRGKKKSVIVEFSSSRRGEGNGLKRVDWKKILDRGTVRT